MFGQSSWEKGTNETLCCGTRPVAAQKTGIHCLLFRRGCLQKFFLYSLFRRHSLIFFVSKNYFKISMLVVECLVFTIKFAWKWDRKSFGQKWSDYEFPFLIMFTLLLMHNFNIYCEIFFLMRRIWGSDTLFTFYYCVAYFVCNVLNIKNTIKFVINITLTCLRFISVLLWTSQLMLRTVVGVNLLWHITCSVLQSTVACKRCKKYMVSFLTHIFSLISNFIYLFFKV